MYQTNVLELLAPAKNLDFGKSAIDHGADAVYIGAPQFSARANAGNPVSDIEKLVQYAHLFKSKVYVTLNTLFFNSELDDVKKIIFQLYEIGIDALIVQDMGLLELDLPPLALYASTQCNITNVEKVRFLEKVGFQRVILARELSVQQIKEIHEQTNIELEAFIHGALCVCYSGQCYMSHAIAGRSGNRGVCSQPCRSSYDLYNSDGELLKKNSHLLSLKDFNASAYLQDLIQAGVTSFKIEGRLKDLSYVKNITAHYRLLLDNIIDNNKDYLKSSSGKTTFFFQPDPEKTFNRSYTSYFLNGRTEKAAFPQTQKSIGKKVGEVDKVFSDGSFTLEKKHKLNNGDGLCFFNEESVLEGFLVNNIEQEKISPSRKLQLQPGYILYRNHDIEFEKQMSQKSAVRKIDVSLIFAECENGFSLQLTDEDEVSVCIQNECIKEIARQQNDFQWKTSTQLSKLGETPFHAVQISILLDKAYFLPASFLNELRRKAVFVLMEKRIQHFYSKNIFTEKNNYPYFQSELDYTANILNAKAVDFYKRHGVETFEYGLEKENKKAVTLMTTKHCIKYQLDQCPVFFNQSAAFSKPLFLKNNGKTYSLTFDCKKCVMRIKEK